ncbi:MAG TPA: oxalate:formate antiporter [Parasulfuritortus sp.]
MNQANEGTSPVALIVFWLYVGIPLVWGVMSTLEKAMALFR